MKKTLLILVGLLLLITKPAFAQTFSVTTPATFQSALTTAQSNGEDDIINVAPGTYNITSTLTYTSDDGDGGHTLTISGDASNRPILNGGNAHQIMYIETYTSGNSDTGGDIEISSLVFQNGDVSQNGAGAYVKTFYANIAISDALFTNNHSGAVGGGSYAFSQYGRVTVSRNVFNQNTGDGGGGGIYIYSAYGSSVIVNNIFSGNTISGGASGGGLRAFLNENATATVTNNSFYDNTAGWYGGGAIIDLARDTSTANVYNNIFWNNAANHGSNDGDDLALFNYNYSTNATINLYNNDFSGNADFSTGQSEDLLINYPNNYNHDDNLQINPQFANASGNDFHLRATSPVINQGLNSAPSLPATDFEGESRILDNTVDMGADEYNAANPPAGSIPTTNEWGMMILLLLTSLALLATSRKEGWG